ncbi:MAG: restriction endonuclease subunit S [Cellvibrionaceae bacterium]|nr:restriction endonuclease subunit S [Cellvibrionaceae bacterium]
MGSEWRKGVLSEIAEIVMGQSPKGKDCNENSDGLPLLNGPTEFGPSHPLPTQFTTDPKKYARVNDLLFCVRGSTTGRMNWADQEYAIGRGIGAFRHKLGSAHQPYLRALIEYHLPTLLQSATGSTFPNVSRNQLLDLEIDIAPENDSGAISKVIGTLDRKIQLNRQTNHTLEKMAQALFKSWFVDFDPVIDNALAAGNPIPPELEARAKQRAEVLAQAQTEAGKPSQENANSGEGDNNPPAYLSPEIRKLFPSEFEETEELGWVPKGWSIKDMTDLVDTVSETYPLKSVDKVIFLNTGDIEAGQFLHENYSSVDGLPGQAKKSIRQDDILYSEIRPKNKRYAYVNFEAGEHVVSTKLMVLRSKGAVSSKFAYFVLSRTEVLNELQRIAELRSGTFPQITYKELSLVNVVIPDDQEILKLFSSLILDVYYKQQFHLQEQNVELEKLRDTLLPKLISGELRLPSTADTKPSLKATTP